MIDNKKKKKINILWILLLLTGLTSGCVINKGAKVYNDHTLIAEDYNTYNLIWSKQNVDGNHLTGSAETFEGMGTIWKFSAEDKTDITISYRLKVSSGKAKLVLISPDDTVTILAECTADQEIEQASSDIFQAEKGENRIKLVGAKGTKIEFDITVDKGGIRSFSS